MDPAKIWTTNEAICDIRGRKDFQYVFRDARDFALLNGLVLRYPHLTNDNNVAHIPFTLFPSPFPKNLYEECCNIQPIINELMFKIANDQEYLEETLVNLIQVDDFTNNLFEINNIVQKEGLAQQTISCINRSDYLLDKDLTRKDDDHNSICVKQVEVNAIASSMSAHSNNVQRMHQFLMSKYEVPIDKNFTIPQNGSITLIAQGLADAFTAYDKSDAFILLVAEERSNNFSDQVLIELELHKIRPDIRIVRRKFIDLASLIRLGPNKELLLDDSSKEVALVYFRYGYDPSNYTSQESWKTRLTMERSRAIKCPSINFHLSGLKKFQQVLNTPKQLEKFLKPNDAERLSKLFCRIYPVDAESADGQRGFKLGMTRDDLVLKPQREGGGHNIFRKNVKSYLGQLNDEERTQYILMELINSPPSQNWLLLEGDEANRSEDPDNLISELGIYGSILGGKITGIECNKSAGYLIRSKKDGVDEGGVASGHAGIGNLVLY